MPLEDINMVLNFSRIIKNNQLIGLLSALFIIIITFSIIDIRYISSANLIDILNQSIINGILAVGITVVIIGGGIDLSIGAILALAVVFGGQFLVNGMPIPLAILATLMIGLCAGLFNGFLIAKMGLQAFIATLGTMSTYRGLAYLVTGGWPILNIPSDFRRLLEGHVFEGIPLSLFILFAFVIIGSVLLKKTRFGIYTYAIGNNEEATRLSGVQVNFHKIWAYGFCGVGAALAGPILIARLGTGEPTSGQGYELDAIAASAIGGTSLAGGKGSIIGTLIGTVLLSALRNGLIVTGVDTFWQFIATGVIIILAVYIDCLQMKAIK